jgi:predicted nucleotidyltransferase
MATFDFLPVLAQVIDAFEALGIAYHIGGSVASSAHGAFRTTMDVDLVADMRREHVEALADKLQPDFYAESDDIQDALKAGASFNVIHIETGQKIDVFPLRPQLYDQEAFMRADLLPLDDAEDARVFFVASPEDTVLNKLRWFRMGGETSERQWLDVQGVLKVQAEALDYAYMRKWAPEINVADLLERAISESGITP